MSDAKPTTRPLRFKWKILTGIMFLPVFALIVVAAYVTVQIELQKWLHPKTTLSYELEFVDPAPQAATRKVRVWLWIHQRKDLINAAARKYNVSAEAIAGVIAWEALENPEEHSLPKYLYIQKLKFEGPGKIHAQDFEPSKNAASFLEGNPRYQPVLPVPAGEWYAPTIVRRVLKLSTSEGSIEYIAAIFNAYATEAERVGYSGDGRYYLQMGIRNKPEILATYFNGVRGFDLPHAAQAFQKRMRKRGFAPFRHSSLAGKWIVRHKAFLKTSLELPGFPRNSVVEDMTWYARQVTTARFYFVSNRRFWYLKPDPCSIIG